MTPVSGKTRILLRGYALEGNHNLGSTKSIFAAELKPNDVVRTSFLVKSRELAFGKNGKPYLIMLLGDKTGDIDTRVWQDAELLAESCVEGSIVYVSGKTSHYQNRLQLIVDNIAPMMPQEVSLENYLPASPDDLEQRFSRLLECFEGLSNEWVKQLGLALLRNPEIGSRYKLCPAAKTVHHAFVGGLLCHSLQLIEIAKVILPFYEDIDHDRVVFGCAFHDFGKIFELAFGKATGYTDEGKLVGHITIGVTLIDREIQKISGFPKELEWELKHLVLSHHGHLEYGSPKRPHTIEAEFVHLLDLMDSRLESIQGHLRSDRSNSRWTALHRAYDQYYFKPGIPFDSSDD